MIQERRRIQSLENSLLLNDEDPLDGILRRVGKSINELYRGYQSSLITDVQFSDVLAQGNTKIRTHL